LVIRAGMGNREPGKLGSLFCECGPLLVLDLPVFVK